MVLQAAEDGEVKPTTQSLFPDYKSYFWPLIAAKSKQRSAFHLLLFTFLEMPPQTRRAGCNFSEI